MEVFLGIFGKQTSSKHSWAAASLFIFSAFSRGSLFLISLERQLLIRMDRRVFAMALFSVSIESLL